MRRTSIGTLKPGSVGNAALLKIKRGRVVYVDAMGGGMKANARLVPLGVVHHGKWRSDSMSKELTERK